MKSCGPPTPSLFSSFLAMGLKWHTVLNIGLNVEKLKEAQDSNSKSSISSDNKKYYSYCYKYYPYYYKWHTILKMKVVLAE
jgi:hypothetical protein